MKTYDELNDQHMDVLREIGNIGAGNAATALAAMLDEKVAISLPRVRITDFDTAVSALGGAERITVGVLVNFAGEARGMIMFLLKMEDAQNITNMLLGDMEDEAEGQLSELKISAIKEIGNILSSSYIGSLSTLTGLQIQLSIPYVAVDMAGALMSVPVIEFGAVGDNVMFIEEHFSAEEQHLTSNIVMFAEMDTLKIIMERLGMDL